MERAKNYWLARSYFQSPIRMCVTLLTFVSPSVRCVPEQVWMKCSLVSTSDFAIVGLSLLIWTAPSKLQLLTGSHARTNLRPLSIPMQPLLYKLPHTLSRAG